MRQGIQFEKFFETLQYILLLALTNGSSMKTLLRKLLEWTGDAALGNFFMLPLH